MSSCSPSWRRRASPSPPLTIDNYTTVLGGVLAQLDKAGTLAEQAAREQVTAAVEAARDQIRAAVTEAVQQQVTAQVTEQVRQQVLGQVLNAMGYTMEQYQQSPELKAQVDAAVELQMQTPAMQQTISENVTALMGTEEIRQKIDAATGAAGAAGRSRRPWPPTRCSRRSWPLRSKPPPVPCRSAA